ncbi:cell envelope integrity protein TolA [Aquamicrobium terrae]|uniref:Colicin import membrane protein n=1 Tax=Aquamicrobium terrae TaxID=1324945 RepID=A0ABV2N7R0_9HYPH
MKASLTTSLALHAAVLAFGLVSLSAPAAFEVSDVESLPVDIVPLEELTQIQQGDKQAPMNEKPAPTPTQRPDVVADAREIGENTVDTDKPVTPDPKPVPVDNASAPPPSPTPQEKPAPEEVEKPKEEPKPVPATDLNPVPQPREEVKPDPVKQPEPKPEPVKQPEPAPKPAEEKVAEAKPEPAKPDAVAEAIAAEEKPVEAAQLPNSAPVPEAKPRPRPAEAQTAKAPERKDSDKPAKEAASRPKSDEKDFNADEIAALLDKRKPSGGGAKRSSEQASLGGTKTTGGNRLSQNEMDALRQKLGGCWSIPAGVDDAGMLKVSVRFRLDRSGTLEGRPEVIAGGASSGPGRTAAESAVRAVQKCAPFNLPADKYDSWAEVVVNFDPSDMF